MYLDYSGIRVKDLGESTKFYTKGLGLKERRRGTMWHGGIWVLLEDPKSHQRLELNWYPRGSKYCSRYSVGEGHDHIGIRVPNVSLAVKRLVKAGAKLIGKPWEDKGVPVVAYLRDPNGLWLELILTKGA